MVMAVALDEARLKERRVKGRDTIQTPFFGSRDRPDLPLASLNKQDPGAFSSPHFHVVDQFQVAIGGKATLGRHNVAPYGIHFSRAYTPYGPLVADATEGLSFFVMRAHPDTGGQHLPDEMAQLNAVPDRQPWQVTRQAVLPSLQSGEGAESARLEAVPGIQDDQGLAGYALNMKPNAHIDGPDPSRSEGQYVVVLTGSLLHDNKEYKAPALAFVFPKEGPLRIHSGSDGLGAIILNFPQVVKRAAREEARSDAAGMKKWQCTLCSFAYDEAQGLPSEGIAPGTRWADVPDSWNCPDCAAGKDDFTPGGV